MATNIAAALARHSAVSARVCLVDADPFTLDVTTRVGLRGAQIEDYARAEPPTTGRLGRLHSPAMSVVPCGGAAIGRVRFAAERALPILKESHDVVVCDLPSGPSGPGRAIGDRLESLDWLILAVTPERSAVAAASHFLELFQTARDRGVIDRVKLAVVCTGDESSTFLSTDEVEAMLDVVVAGRVPQLWGRAEPNFGFGPALSIPELDDAVYDLFVALQLGSDRPRSLISL